MGFAAANLIQNLTYDQCTANCPSTGNPKPQGTKELATNAKLTWHLVLEQGADETEKCRNIVHTAEGTVVLANIWLRAL